MIIYIAHQDAFTLSVVIFSFISSFSHLNMAALLQQASVSDGQNENNLTRVMIGGLFLR